MIEFDKQSKTWKVNIPGWGIEEGSLQYVVGEYIGGGLVFPYNIAQTRSIGVHGHAHEFDGVLIALLNNPDSFSVDGFEEYYSEQELEVIRRLQSKIVSEPNAGILHCQK